MVLLFLPFDAYAILFGSVPYLSFLLHLRRLPELRLLPIKDTVMYTRFKNGPLAFAGFWSLEVCQLQTGTHHFTTAAWHARWVIYPVEGPIDGGRNDGGWCSLAKCFTIALLCATLRRLGRVVEVQVRRNRDLPRLWWE